MSDMHSNEYGPEAEEQLQQETEQRVVVDERNTRSFFMLLCFFLAAILLAVFLAGGHDTLIQMLLLFGVIGLVILGVRFFEKGIPRRVSPQISASIPNDTRDTTQQAGIQKEEDDERRDDLTSFELLVQEALDSIPEEFHTGMQNLAVIVEEEPDEATQQRVGIEEGHILLGLYQGVPLTSQSYSQMLLPEQITIYQHTIEHYCHGDPNRIRAQVRSTVLHEVAHHFGMGHEEMPIWVR
jgi:predicted Zn-dependent protease with MMP-like domain/uncharacterized integral membrane protein